jgi:hypothetical protein
VATVHNTIKETIRAHLTLVHVFHVYASVDTLWVVDTLFHFTPIRYGRIASVSVAHEATQFVGPHKIPYAPVHNSNLLSGPDDRSLTDTSRGYHLEAPNFRLDHSSFFASSILPFPLIAPLGLQLYQPFDHLANHISPLSIERALSRVDSNHSSSTDSLHN